MKKNKIYTLFAGILVLVALAGCKEDYEPIENRIYISEALSKNVAKVSVNVGEKTLTNFTVRMSKAMASDVHATLEIDESILEAYNAETLAGYSLLPLDKVSFEKDVVIESGKAMAAPTVVTIESYTAEEGVKYALPVRVVSDGSVAPEKLGAQYLLLLDKPWAQSTPYLGRGAGFKSDNETPIPMDSYTIEFWLWMDGFSAYNQCVIDCATFYIRLGNSNGQVSKEQMQINAFGAGGENNKVFFAKYSFQQSTWTHVAITYDQAKCCLIINGELAQEVDVAGVPAPLKTITFFNGNTTNNHMMGQARLWNRVLTTAEIKENMGGPVTVSPSLIGYWKMDEGEGTTINDSSGNEKHAVKATGSSFSWRHDQCFLNP